jgi:uncharacterized protein YtpQ (UPF0354 family)
VRKFAQTVIVALGLCVGCSRSNVLSSAEFTQEFAQALRQSSPGLKVEIVKDMELDVTKTDGSHVSVFLGNAYDLYSHDPKSKDEIIRKYVAADLETLVSANFSEEIDRTRIVPIIKDKPWLDQFKEDLAHQGGSKLPEAVYEELNSDLVIVYAEDSPKSIRYLAPKDLEKAHVERKELRALACTNLVRLLPKVDKEGANGLYVLSAGGDYDASLLLLDSVWSDLQKNLHGDIVVAIPTRDILMVTGSEDSPALKEMRKLVDDAFTQGSYKLTKQLFVRRNGAFTRFTDTEK